MCYRLKLRQNIEQINLKEKKICSKTTYYIFKDILAGDHDEQKKKNYPVYYNNTRVRFYEYEKFKILYTIAADGGFLTHKIDDVRGYIIRGRRP